MNILGRTGEKYAIGFLKRNGYRIKECNWKCKIGEIDIVAFDHNILCIIEVKTRQNEEFGGPWEAIDTRKKCKILKIAQWYCADKNVTDTNIRFDAVFLLTNPQGRITNAELLKDAIR
jgi:putative endonuclease